MAAYTTLVNLPHFLSSFTSLETGALVLFLVAVFTVQLILLQNYSGRRRWLPLILCAAALLALELGILAVKYLFLSVFSGDGWSALCFWCTACSFCYCILPGWRCSPPSWLC